MPFHCRFIVVCCLSFVLVLCFSFVIDAHALPSLFKPLHAAKLRIFKAIVMAKSASGWSRQWFSLCKSCVRQLREIEGTMVLKSGLTPLNRCALGNKLSKGKSRAR